MLPSDLLVARARKGFIYPLFSNFDALEIHVAKRLIEVFAESVGAKRRDLEEKVKKVEDIAFKLGLDYRFARGLAHLLYRKTRFSKPEAAVDPVKARLEVFKIASEKFGGFTLNEEERAEVFASAASKLGVSVKELISSFTAVYEELQVVEEFDALSPIELLKTYNLSLAQTLLFKALDLTAEVEISGTEMKMLLFNVKRLGLMYLAEKNPRGIRLYIDGPASIVKQTERYGTRLAKLLPYITCARKWSIRARVRRRGVVYKFRLDDKYSRLFPKSRLELEEYDSRLEKIFHRRFTTLGSGWKIRREPEPLIAGKHVFIPDFVFEKNGVKVYFEIMGFWTREYLDRKLEKLRNLEEVKMILAVNSELACSSDIGSLPFEVILFKNKISTVDVYNKLKKFDVEKSVEYLEIQVPEEVLEYLKTIKRELLSKVLKKLKDMGVEEDKALKILEKTGFQVRWSSLDPSKVYVEKKG
ncbi:MAG: hypothetical protein DRJ37_03870 [Thermoprotei archaeon]|nr:MAG: hypothetical protein DRJ37_03870 [Thermoprotei archaeon]